MTYRIIEAETIEQAMQRISHEQIEKLIAEIDDTAIRQDVTVHQVRKRCKKLRSVIRLVRPAFEKTYQRENQFFRDRARTLSDARDTDVMIEAYDALVDSYGDQVERITYAPIRRHLKQRSNQDTDEQSELTNTLDEVRQSMEHSLHRVATWKLKENGYKAIAGGLKKTYQRGRKAMIVANNKSTDENFHEWHKRAKYHQNHLKLLRNLWHPMLTVRSKVVKKLTELLGDDHDLAVLRNVLARDSDQFSDNTMLEVFLGLIDRRRVELQYRANWLGQRIYADKPRVLIERMGAYWKARNDESEQQRKLIDIRQLAA